MVGFCLIAVALGSIAGGAIAAGPPIDTSAKRAQTPLDPGLRQIGTIRPRSTDEIPGSNWTLGCETLDRDYADYEQYREYLVPLGIKTIRLQGGWAKTERVKGTYDFTWLDTIIDDARGRGLNILLETGYGNTVYEGGGGWDLAGGFPTSDEALRAWDRWVEAMATRYKGKVRDWAMWNEPDINKQHKPEDIATFNIRTAAIIRRVIPDARIAGLSLASSSPQLLDSCLKVLAERDKVDLFHWFIYHGYAFNPDSSYRNVEALKATLAKYSSTAKVRQGENGCPSELATRFALSNHPWTEYSQAKWDLRRMLGDLGHDIESAVFTICDFNHTGREINRKGLLRATADKKVEKIKLAYYSVQNCVAVFDDTLERIREPAITVTYAKPTACFAFRSKTTGHNLVVLWDNSGTPDDSFVTHPAQVEVKGLAIREPVWVDLVSGRIYEIPADRITTADGTTIFKSIPIYDAPVLIAERSALLPPNIVFILVDDLGWSDLGCYGNQFTETPCTDSLAADGMRFTAAYTAPVCTPSRGMILSGQYSARTGLYKVPFRGNDRPWARVVPPENWGDRPIGSKPLGAILSGGGYASKLLGKVHVPKPFTEGLDGTADPQKAKAALGEAFHQKVLDFSRDNPGKEVGPITQQAIEFIASNKEGPFFCYVGHHIPHIPLVARDELTRKYEAKWKRQPAQIHPHYAAMCEAMDDSVGLILETLDRLGLRDNTLIVFFSDNGGVQRCFNDGRGAQVTDLAPFRGEKGGIYEGGIRVPLIVRWPGRVKPGSVCDTPVISTDFLPTFAEAAGVSLPEKQIVDGMSLVPMLQGGVGADRAGLFTYFPDYHHDFPGMAVRDGDYKLIESSEDGHLELYNLAEDVGEQHNLAAQRPQKVAELKQVMHVWQRDLDAKQATPNPEYDPWKQHLLAPDAEPIRQRYLPTPWPPTETQGSAQALLRDCDRGYLLNCSFRAIRAYPWRNKVPLTGWETDDRGGFWEASPVGFLPDQFGFHVDWFRLHDTSTDHGVTIRHQIARQTSGVVTWEFRFMMPTVMEGAGWQLCDMKAAAVSIMVRDGVLCCESTGTPPVPLEPIQAGREYGVRAIVDLAKRNTRISVDGKLLAANVPLLHQAESLDYVLIKTGDEAVGQLFLPVVNVHLGYVVNESFLTAGTGSLPDDWRRVSATGNASVEPFRCAARPDVLSLRLTTGGTVNREFAATGKKTVFEYRILLPEKRDGATVAFHGHGRQMGAIRTVGGDLCYMHPADHQTVLVHDYRENLWYAIKMIADPRSASIECLVNGKPAARNLSLGSEGIEFAQVQVAAPPEGTLWLDDVRVYPWRDYPADYVPEPKPINQTDDYLVGAQSCSLWKEGDAYAGWDYVYPYAGNRKPYLGWYDEGNPEVADWEIKWQVEHGIDFEQYCWYRPNDAVNHPIKNGVLEHGIREGLFNARYSGLKKFTIMYTNSGAGRTNPDDWQRHLIPYWIEYFFQDPRYLKIDGKPVLAIYHLENLLADLGGEAGTASAVKVLREACREAGFPGILLLCEERYARQATIEQMKTVGMDYCYSYTWVTGDSQRQRQKMEAQRETAGAAGLGVVPSVSVGWEPTPWGQPGDGWVSVDDYKALAQWTKTIYMPSLPEASLGRNMVLLPNWNEFAEGHFIMPSTLAGFGYVDALRAVFCGAGPHEDPVPTKMQKRRFTVLYPRD